MALKEIFTNIEKKLTENPPRKMNAVFQFDFSGDEETTYTVSVKEGEVEVKEAPAESADITIGMTSSDFEALIDGTLDSMGAFLSGQIKIDGDVGLAMKLEELVK